MLRAHCRNGPVPELFHVTLVHPEAYPAGEVLRAGADILLWALRGAGVQAALSTNSFVHDATNILVGAHLLAPEASAALPPDTIVFNTEPLVEGSPQVESLRPFLARYTVWDYDPRNAAVVRAMGNDAVTVIPAGYLPELCRVVHREDKDVDVLFFGQMSAHRRAVLDAMQAQGQRVVWLRDVYGAERDAWIGRSRVVLNVHYRPRAPLESGRIAYLLCNRCVVLAEADEVADIDADLQDALAAAPAASLAQLAQALLDDPARCALLASRGFAAIRRRDYARNVRRAIAATHERRGG